MKHKWKFWKIFSDKETKTKPVLKLIDIDYFDFGIVPRVRLEFDSQPDVVFTNVRMKIESDCENILRIKGEIVKNEQT